MNTESLGQFLMLTFMPFVPELAGAVLAIIGLLLIVVMFREFLPDKKE